MMGLMPHCMVGNVLEVFLYIAMRDHILHQRSHCMFREMVSHSRVNVCHLFYQLYEGSVGAGCAWRCISNSGMVFARWC